MKNQIKKNTQKPMMAILMCTLLLIVSIFLPYMTAEADFIEILEAAEQDTSLSLLDFSQIYLEEDENTLVIIVGILAGLAMLAALLAVWRKPFGVLIFGILDTAWAVIIHMVFSDGVYTYKYAIANRLIFVACSGLLVSAIWMLVVKIKVKHSLKRKRMTAENYKDA